MRRRRYRIEQSNNADAGLGFARCDVRSLRLRGRAFQLDLDTPNCSRRTSPRFSRWPMKPGFGQINIALDSAQGLVVDGPFIAQFDHGVAFCL